MKKNSFLAKFYMFMVFFFLFAPIVVMILFSFNAGKSTSVFEGFSLKWYLEMITNDAILEAVRNTLLLAVTSSVISTTLGTVAAYGINKMRSPVKKIQNKYRYQVLMRLSDTSILPKIYDACTQARTRDVLVSVEENPTNLS